MSPLNQQDREWVQAVARELAFEAIKQVLAEHVKSCPHGQLLARTRAWAVGVAVGLGAAGFGMGLGLSRLLPWAL